MPWIDTNQPVSCMAFLGPDGHLQACVDVFPSRVSWKSDPDDLVGAFANAMLQLEKFNAWGHYALMNAQKGFSNRFAEALPNAIIAHKGPAIPNPYVWRLHNGCVITPDGQTWSVAQFCGSPRMCWLPLGDIYTQPTFKAEKNTLFHCVVTNFLSSPKLHAQMHIHALLRFVYSALVRARGSVFSNTTPSQSLNHVGDILTSAMEEGYVQGDRPYAPKKLLLNGIPDLQVPYPTFVNDVHMIVDMALESGIPLDDLDPHQAAEQSAHTILSVRSLEHAIDAQLSSAQTTIQRF